MADKMSEFNFDDQWDKQFPDQEAFGEFLSTPSASAASAASAVSAVSSAPINTSTKTKRYNTDHEIDPTKWCKICHTKPCVIIKTAVKKAGIGAAVVANRKTGINRKTGMQQLAHADAGAIAGAVFKEKYNPTMTMESFDPKFELQSGNSFGIESPLAPIFTGKGEDYSGLHRAPWIEKDKLEQDFPYGVLDPSRDPNDPFGMGGGSKSSKRSSKKSSRKAKKSSKRSSKKSYRKSSRKSSRKAKRS